MESSLWKMDGFNETCSPVWNLQCGTYSVPWGYFQGVDTVYLGIVTLYLGVLSVYPGIVTVYSGMVTVYSGIVTVYPRL